MANVDNFGGGYKVNEQPVEYYQIIDQRKGFQSTVINDSSFDKILQNNIEKNTVKNNKAIKPNFEKPTPNNLSKNISNNKPSGIEIARMKEVAKQVTDQFYSFLWNQMSDKMNQNPLGGFGEAMFKDKLREELYKSASGPELDEIGTAIFNDLMRQRGFVEQNDIKPKK